MAGRLSVHRVERLLLGREVVPIQLCRMENSHSLPFLTFSWKCGESRGFPAARAQLPFSKQPKFRLFR